ncbi:aminoglycoside phosphotransferase family protein [Pedococcus soli]
MPDRLDQSAPPTSSDDTGPDGRAGIDASVVRRLLHEQFPQWAGLPVRPVPVDGWDNRTYRLGEDLSVRLPTHERYVAGVAKEARWLPVLAPYLPLPVPEVVANGRPGPGYPHPWSVRRWVEGATASASTVPEGSASTRFALDLAGFLGALRAAPAAGGPLAGEHSFHRGGDLGVYAEEAEEAFGRLEPGLAAGALDVFQTALTTRWTGDPVWFHGDVATGNLLVRDERLAAVIDFGTSGVGDPACDLVIAWTFLAGRAREVFREAIGLDADTWARARGWAVWKSAVDLDRDVDANLRILGDVVAEHRALTRTGR